MLKLALMCDVIFEFRKNRKGQLKFELKQHLTAFLKISEGSSKSQVKMLFWS